MWLCARIRGKNTLAALKELRVHGRRYKIEKVQRLGETFERACWRGVRTAEERTYLKKYHFIKHCINVIDNIRNKKAQTHATPEDVGDAQKFLEQMTEKYDGNNTEECMKDIQDYISAINDRQKAQDTPRDIDTINRLTKMANKLQERQQLIAKHGDNPDVIGYNKNKLRRMIGL